MLYVIENPSFVTDDEIIGLYNALPAFRKAYADRYKNANARRLNILAFSLLQKGLREEYGITEPPEFAFGSNGKPYLKNYSGIFFSLSHCREGAACYISESENGLDIEEYRDISYRMAKRVCNADELRTIKESPDPARKFARLWTAKESVAKLYGTGLACNIKELDISRVKTVEYNRFVLSYCEAE